MAQFQHSHRRPEKIHDINFQVRQILNGLFMIIGFIGCLIYCRVIPMEDSDIKGAIIVIIAILIKMGECMIRLLKKKPEEEEEDDNDNEE